MEKPKARFLSPAETLAIARARTPAERFFMLLKLIKLQRMLSTAQRVK